jgi:hypothetical protein
MLEPFDKNLKWSEEAVFSMNWFLAPTKYVKKILILGLGISGYSPFFNCFKFFSFRTI